jgi:hypothetical protein
VTKNDFTLFQEKMDHRSKEFESRVVIKLGALTVSSLSIAVAVLAWLIKL